LDNGNKHIVNQINATINCNHKNLASLQELGLGELIANGLENLAPYLDKNFGDDIVRFQDIEIAVDIEQNAINSISAQISTALKNVLEESLGTTKSDNNNTSAAITAKAITQETIFLHFLEYGTIPWFNGKINFEELPLEDNSFIKLLKTLLTKSVNARIRLVKQLSKEQLNSLLRKVCSKSFYVGLSAFIASIKTHAGHYSERYGAAYLLNTKMQVAALHSYFGKNKSNSFQEFLSRYWSEFISLSKEVCNGKHGFFLAKIKEQLPVHLVATLPTTEQVIGFTTAKEAAEATNKEATLSDAFKEKEKNQGQLVSNAGIILLHPFIPRFFNKLGLIENGQFISLTHQQRAICLLHYLATSKEEFPEEELVLQKHLCNYPLDGTLPKELPISPFEKEEAEIVLQSALQHWTALKSKSSHSLQVNFLRRKGMLEPDSLGFLLHVENQTADILLNQLPWVLSMVQWSWLPNLLTIKWR